MSHTAVLLIAFTSVLLLSTADSRVLSTTPIRNALPEFDHGIDLPTTRPLIIAHRGYSGAYPEHTVLGYRRAVDEGADVVECDLTITRDLVLICMHENWMNLTTDVADVFPVGRANTYYVPDEKKMVTDYFAVDFSYDELKENVRKRQRFSFRDPNYNGQLGIASFDEYVNVLKNAGRPVGLHIETKDPLFINSRLAALGAGTTFEDLLLQSLVGHGYDVSDPRQPIFIQSFNEQSLRYIGNRTDVRLPLVMLLSDDDDLSDDRLRQLAQFAYGIGPYKKSIIRTNSRNQISERTDLVSRSHALGLRVQPYTLRNERDYLAWDYAQDPQNEYQDFFEIGVDGVFTDFPQTYKAFLDTLYARCD